MNVIIHPSNFCGEVQAPASKSLLIRAIFCAMLSKGTSKIYINNHCDDVLTAINCIKKLGAHIILANNILTVTGTNFSENKKSIVLDCNDSAAVLRFLLPITCALGIQVYYTGSDALKKRPINELISCLSQNGAEFSSNCLPFNTNGKLKSGDYIISGNISSQYISGLLLALPLLNKDSKIIVKNELVSLSYIDLTISVLQNFGINIAKTDYGYFIKGNCKFTSCDYHAEGDISGASFFLCMGAVNGDVTVKGININTLQGDMEICDILRRFGADVYITENSIRVKNNSLYGIELNAENIPDLVPAIASVATVSEGITTINGIQRLSLKESNRITSVCDMINSVGGCAKHQGSAIIIDGKPTLLGGNINGAGDHRIVMASSILSGKCLKPVEISDCDSVSKSYPNFWGNFKAVGGVFSYVGK